MSEKRIIASYIVRCIYRCYISMNSSSNYYSVKIAENLESIISFLAYKILKKVIRDRRLSYLSDFKEFIKELKNLVNQDLKQNKNLTSTLLNKSKEEIDAISTVVAYKCLGFHNLIPLFLDENIDEIYVNSSTGDVFLDHRRFGRLKALFRLTPEEIEKLVYISKFMANQPVSIENPSLKVSLLTQDFHFRISIDFPPLTPYGPYLDIRRIHKSPLPPHYWVQREEDLDSLSFLITMLALRPNIVIAGEPGSGKTSLLAFLLAIMPRKWRIIIIEDVRELPDLSRYQKNVMYIKVRPYEAGESQYSKEKEIIKLLHRSPDYVAIGELQSRGDNLAFFHALSTGIRGLGTIHATNITELINRWINVFNINESLINNIDIIVFMKKKILKDKISRGIGTVFINSSQDIQHKQKVMASQLIIKTANNWLRLNSKNILKFIRIMLQRRFAIENWEKNDALNSVYKTYKIIRAFISNYLKEFSEKFFHDTSNILSELNDILELSLGLYGCE
ncbi:MAG: ATPase, T2SS/T4P/T4SS family [Candidatus Njordarchaeales archaeon]